MLPVRLLDVGGDHGRNGPPPRVDPALAPAGRVLLDALLLDRAGGGVATDVGRGEIDGLLDDGVRVETGGFGLGVVVFEVLVAVLEEEEVEGLLHVLPEERQLGL
jgi:hypothetical protein